MKRSRNHNDLTEIENKNARWDIPGNINIDNTGKIHSYSLSTNSLDISGNGNIRG